MTYEELNHKANELAFYIQHTYYELLNKSLTKKTLIALVVERNLNMIIGILSILKLGCAYVPIEPVYPPQRINFILEDSGIKIALTQSHLLSLLNKINSNIDYILIDNPKIYTHQDKKLFF